MSQCYCCPKPAVARVRGIPLCDDHMPKRERITVEIPKPKPTPPIYGDD